MVASSAQTESVTQYGSLLLVVFNSILGVFILCVAGYLLAYNGILDKKTQKRINRLNISLFTPALLFSKVAFFLTPQKLRELWVIPIFFVIVTTVSGLIAFILGWAFRLKRSQRSFAMAAAMFMNSNSLPIALMQSLVVTVPDLRWDSQDNVDAMLGRALTYLVMYSTLGMIVRWSYGVKLLTQADPETTEAEIEETAPLLGENSSAIDSYPGSTCEYEGAEISRLGIHRCTQSYGTTSIRRPLSYFTSFPNSPNLSRTNLTQYGAIRLKDDDESPGFSRQPEVELLRRVQKSIIRFLKAFNDFMTAPLWAALASIVVAFIPPLQEWLKTSARPLSGALSSAGNCSIPLTLVVLGGYFYPEVPESPKMDSIPPSRLTASPSTSTLCGDLNVESASPNKTPARKGESMTVLISILSRMILTPLVLMPLVVSAAKYDWHAIFEDPVFVVINVLLLASPPAVTLAQITQAASGDAFERLISRTIFWSYCVFTPPTVIVFVLLGLVLSKM